MVNPCFSIQGPPYALIADIVFTLPNGQIFR